MQEKPEYYREEAKRSREIARSTRDSDMREHLLDIARQYDQLAEKAVCEGRLKNVAKSTAHRIHETGASESPTAEEIARSHDMIARSRKLLDD